MCYFGCLNHAPAQTAISALILIVIRSMDREDSVELPCTPVLENPEHQTKWYYKYFLGKYHSNYMAQDGDKHTFVLSVLEEKSFGKTLIRAILWAKDRPRRLCIRQSEANASTKQILAHFGCSEKLEKSLREVRLVSCNGWPKGFILSLLSRSPIQACRGSC